MWGRKGRELFHSYVESIGLEKVTRAAISHLQATHADLGGFKGPKQESALERELVRFWDHRLRTHDPDSTPRQRRTAIWLLVDMAAHQMQAWEDERHSQYL